MNDKTAKINLSIAKSPAVRLYFFCALLAATILLIDLSLSLGVAAGVPYVAVVLMSLWSSNNRLALYLAAICSILTVIGFYFSPEGGEIWKVVVNRLLALFTIWVTAILLVRWRLAEQRNKQDKEDIYLATIESANHIMNNLLNHLLYVKKKAERKGDFDAEILNDLDDIFDEASTLVKELSNVKVLNKEAIKQSVHPKS